MKVEMLKSEIVAGVETATILSEASSSTDTPTQHADFTFDKGEMPAPVDGISIFKQQLAKYRLNSPPKKQSGSFLNDQHSTDPRPSLPVPQTVVTPELRSRILRRSSRRVSPISQHDLQPDSERSFEATGPFRKIPSSRKRKRTESDIGTATRISSTLPLLPDILAPNLISVFIGTNPGITTSLQGHAYAHPSNQFWKLVHTSGCTTTLLRPDQDGTLPKDWELGNTNIVARASRNAAELKSSEMVEGARILDEKIRACKPESVCIVGKGIWAAIWREKTGKDLKKADGFEYGWQRSIAEASNERDDQGDQDEWERMGAEQGVWDGARIFVATSTSGLCANTSPAQKLEIWRPFGEWVARRREERRLSRKA